MTPRYWDEACAHLARKDRRMARLIETYPVGKLRTRGDPFSTLARSIVGQQISVRAAETVWGRFSATCVEMQPHAVLGHEHDTLRACGLSNSKVLYLKDLSTHFASGQVDPKRWKKMSDDEIIEDLTRIKGIGRWTVEMFLIFHLMRPDVYPIDDIGMVRAIEKLYRKGERMSKAEIRGFGDRWRPWRSVATWYLWRSLDPIIVEY